MAAVLEAPVQGAGVPAAAVERVTSFRFTDVNPMAGRSFACSVFRDLPEFVQDVVEDRLGLTSGEWDALVREGAAVEVTGDGRYGLSHSMRSVQRRLAWDGRPGRWCPDCNGGCVDIDADGSVTGVRGAAYICACMGVF